MPEYCNGPLIRHGRQIRCPGTIEEFQSKVGDRKEIDRRCDVCGRNPDLAPFVVEPVSQWQKKTRI